MSGSEARGRAFTLIELLVVVAIIVLLIAILLPTLRSAKEQARVAVCLSNQRAITVAGVNYCMDKGNPVFLFPWPYFIDGEHVSFGLGTPFIWGGGVPDRRRDEWDDAQGSFNPVVYRADTYSIYPIDRPMNKYLDADVSWNDPARIWNTVERRQLPMELPEYFQCPSDCTAALWNAGTHWTVPADADTPFSTWQWWGNSYAIVYRWAHYYTEGNDFGLYDVLSDGALARKLINSKNSSGAAEFIFFHESRLLNALHAARPRGFVETDPPEVVGWHKQENMFSVGFLDGHAEYRQLDTRYVDGPGWTVWPNRPWSAYWREYEGN